MEEWLSPKPKVHAPVLGFEKPALDEWITTVEHGWNVLWHHVRKLWTPTFPKRRKSNALFNIVMRWERWHFNPERPNHILIRAVRCGGGDATQNRDISILITPLELRELIEYDVLGPRRGDLLSQYTTHTGTYTQRQRLIRDEREEVAQLLVKMLQISNFTGNFQCGKLEYFRRRRGIVRTMRGSRWWSDHLHQKRSGPGPLVWRGSHRFGKHRMSINLFACRGDITIRAYDRRSSRWIDVC